MVISLISSLITCTLCYGIFYIVKWHLKRRRLYEMAAKFKGPATLPIIGNAHLFFGNKKYLLNKLYEIHDSYPSPTRIWMGPLLCLCVSEPEHIKEVCLNSKTLERGPAVEFSRRYVGEGLITASGSTWRLHRKLIQPTFNTKILDSFVQIFADQSKIFTEQLARNLDGPEFEIFKLLSLCTLDMICESAMGVKIGAQTNKNCRYVDAIDKVISTTGERFFNLWQHSDYIFYRTLVGKEQLENIKYLHDFADNVIKRRREEFLKRNTQLNDTTPQKNAFLDHLMEATYNNSSFSDIQLRDEVNTLMVAGTDTNAITISFVMLMLASHPDIQNEVYRELRDIYGNQDIEERPITRKDLTQMEYLERVIKETMRLFPVAPFIIRGAADDLNIGDKILPSGSLVSIGVLNLHRNKKYWPDPLKFHPDRFLPEENAKRHPYTYMAFSGGPRNCIGSNYAMMAMKTLIATILRRYILRKDHVVEIEDIQLTVDILVKPVDPIKLRIERRDKNVIE